MKSQPPAKSKRSAGLEARISIEQKELIERAAAYKGRSVADFVLHVVQSEAKAVLEEHEMLELNKAQGKRFIEDLLRSAKPNAALKRAAAEYLWHYTDYPIESRAHEMAIPRMIRGVLFASVYGWYYLVRSKTLAGFDVRGCTKY